MKTRSTVAGKAAEKGKASSAKAPVAKKGGKQAPKKPQPKKQASEVKATKKSQKIATSARKPRTAKQTEKPKETASKKKARKSEQAIHDHHTYVSQALEKSKIESSELGRDDKDLNPEDFDITLCDTMLDVLSEKNGQKEEHKVEIKGAESKLLATEAEENDQEVKSNVSNQDSFHECEMDDTMLSIQAQAADDQDITKSFVDSTDMEKADAPAANQEDNEMMNQYLQFPSEEASQTPEENNMALKESLPSNGSQTKDSSFLQGFESQSQAET